jgi:hypothetical protein
MIHSSAARKAERMRSAGEEGTVPATAWFTHADARFTGRDICETVAGLIPGTRTVTISEETAARAVLLVVTDADDFSPSVLDAIKTVLAPTTGEPEPVKELTFRNPDGTVRSTAELIEQR